MNETDCQLSSCQWLEKEHLGYWVIPFQKQKLDFVSVFWWELFVEIPDWQCCVYCLTLYLQWQCYKIYFYAFTIQSWLIKHFKPCALLCIDFHLYLKYLECSQVHSVRRNLDEGQPIKSQHHDRVLSVLTSLYWFSFQIIKTGKWGDPNQFTLTQSDAGVKTLPVNISS